MSLVPVEGQECQRLMFHQGSQVTMERSTLICLKPAFSSRSLAERTAWKAVALH